jgi:hypothetical protein
LRNDGNTNRTFLHLLIRRRMLRSMVPETCIYSSMLDYVLKTIRPQPRGRPWPWLLQHRNQLSRTKAVQHPLREPSTSQLFAAHSYSQCQCPMRGLAGRSMLVLRLRTRGHVYRCPQESVHSTKRGPCSRAELSQLRNASMRTCGLQFAALHSTRPQRNGSRRLSTPFVSAGQVVYNTTTALQPGATLARACMLHLETHQHILNRHQLLQRQQSR